MSKVIDLTARAAPVRWVIEVGDCDDYFRCRYINEDESPRGAHWRVFIMASTIDRVQALIKAAKGQLARGMADVSNLDTVKGGRQHGSGQ